jgi:predicted phage-related endonuclease
MSDTDFIGRRSRRIGATDVAAALTGAFERSAATVIAEKLGRITPASPTTAMQRGSDLEAVVAQATCLLIGADLVDWQVEVAHPVRPWFVVTTDARVRFAPGGPLLPLEIKTTRATEGYPLDYLQVQLTAQMLCMEVEIGISSVWDLRSQTLHVVEHQLDTGVAITVEKMAEELHDALCAGRVPEPTFPADSSVWNRLHPDSVSGVVDLPAELVHDLRQSKTAAREAQSRYELLEADVKDLLGDFETGVVDGIPVIRWRTGTWRRIDISALEELYPAIAEEVRVTSTQRRFTILAPTPANKKGQTT